MTPTRGSKRRGTYPVSGACTREWCSRTVTACADGATDCTSGPARSPGRERERDFDLGVLREALRVRKVQGAAAFIDAEAPLLRRTDAGGHAVRIAHEEFCRVHQHASVLLRIDRESPQHRRGEGVGDGLALR